MAVGRKFKLGMRVDFLCNPIGIQGLIYSRLKGVLLWTNVLICFISYLLELLIVKIKMVLEWREGGQLGAKKNWRCSRICRKIKKKLEPKETTLFLYVQSTLNYYWLIKKTEFFLWDEEELTFLINPMFRIGFQN